MSGKEHAGREADMKGKAAILPGLLLLVAAVASACGGGSGPPRTGVPEVDAVVQAVLSGDEEALRGFVRYAPVACSTDAGIGDEPCRPGESDGAVVDALAVADCEGYYIRPDGIDHALAYLLAAEPKLYGAYHTSPEEVSGAYAAVFSVTGPEPGQIFGTELVIDDDGSIVFIDFGCGASPERIAERLGPPLCGTPSPTSAAASSGGR